MRFHFVTRFTFDTGLLINTEKNQILHFRKILTNPSFENINHAKKQLSKQTVRAKCALQSSPSGKSSLKFPLVDFPPGCLFIHPREPLVPLSSLTPAYPCSCLVLLSNWLTPFHIRDVSSHILIDPYRATHPFS